MSSRNCSQVIGKSASSTGVSNTRPARVFCATISGIFKYLTFMLPSSLTPDATKINEPKLNDTQCRFYPAYNTTDKNFTLQEILEKSWEYAKTFTHVLLTSRKHTIEFLVKTFGESCGRVAESELKYPTPTFQNFPFRPRLLVSKISNSWIRPFQNFRLKLLNIKGIKFG